METNRPHFVFQNQLHRQEVRVHALPFPAYPQCVTSCLERRRPYPGTETEFKHTVYDTSTLWRRRNAGGTREHGEFFASREKIFRKVLFKRQYCAWRAVFRGISSVLRLGASFIPPQTPHLLPLSVCLAVCLSATVRP